eukprot:m51a1_g8519 hypothetical protein (382) ;mRNA; f:104615-105868
MEAFFVTVGSGLEPIAAEEARAALGAVDVAVHRGKVTFAAPRGARVASLRCVERAFASSGHWALAPGPLPPSGDALASWVLSACDWAAALRVWSSASGRGRVRELLCFRVSAKVSGRYAAATTSQLLCRRLGPALQQSLNASARVPCVLRADPRRADVELYVHASDVGVFCGVALAPSGSTLSRRRLGAGLRAPVAWAMCWLASPGPGELVLDPMCGAAANVVAECCAAWPLARCAAADADALSARLARDLLAAEGAPCDVVVADAAGRVPLASGSVDAVVADVPFGRQFSALRCGRALQPREAEGDAAFFGGFVSECCRVLRASTGRAVFLCPEGSPLLAALAAAARSLVVAREVRVKLGALPALIVVATRPPAAASTGL